MSEVQTQNPAETVSAKVSVADRKALAKAAFVVGGDVAAIAAAFGNVPNGREFLDVVYSALVTETTLAAVAANEADGIAEKLAPIGELRESVQTAMSAAGVKVNATREVDPIAVRAALVARVGFLHAVAEHLFGAANWVADVRGAIDTDDFSDDEKAVMAAIVVPENVTKLTDRIAALVEKSPKATADGTTTRDTVDHAADAAKLTVGRVIAAKGDAALTCEIVAAVDEKGRGENAYRTSDGELFSSISMAATHQAGGARNGWTYYAL